MSDNMWESHWEKVYGPNSDRTRFKDLSEELKDFHFIMITPQSFVERSRVLLSLTQSISSSSGETQRRTSKRKTGPWRTGGQTDRRTSQRSHYTRASKKSPLDSLLDLTWTEDFPLRGKDDGEKSVEGDRSIGGLMTTCPGNESMLTALSGWAGRDLLVHENRLLSLP